MLAGNHVSDRVFLGGEGRLEGGGDATPPGRNVGAGCHGRGHPRTNRSDASSPRLFRADPQDLALDRGPRRQRGRVCAGPDGRLDLVVLGRDHPEGHLVAAQPRRASARSCLRRADLAVDEQQGQPQRLALEPGSGCIRRCQACRSSSTTLGVAVARAGRPAWRRPRSRTVQQPGLARLARHLREVLAAGRGR